MSEENLIKFTSDNAAEMGRRGGIESGKTRREQATLAAALRKVLDEPASKGSELTRREYIAAKAVTRLANDPKIGDLKTLADILGETVQKVDVSGGEFVIQVGSEDTARKLSRILDGDNADDKDI